jgi:hypothetical protein
MQLVVMVWAAIAGQGVEAIEIGGRRELFVDNWLIERLENARLELARPVDAGEVLPFDRPWEGPFCGYCTIIRDGDTLRAYYRGLPEAGKDGSSRETTCYAESTDGVHWTRPNVGLFEVDGTRENNVVLAGMAPFSHNFSPFLDRRPDVPAEERYKALGGTMHSGLAGFVSGDGLSWNKLREEPVIAREDVPYKAMFDSQNLAFWSEAENCYVAYFRVFENGVRRICRSTSRDFMTWSPPVLMKYRHAESQAPLEHLYTNQTHAYFRAPHLYLAIAARFMPERQVLTDEEARAIHVDPQYFQDTSDAVLMTSRGGATYDRTFLEGFVRPGLGARNWVSRTNYPALNLVQTGPDEMSLYVNQDYAQPTAHLHRYTLRLDGLASVRAGYAGGTMTTRVFQFQGSRLFLNFATSAAGGIRVEIQDADGRPIAGYAMEASRELIGNEIERAASWESGSDVSALAGKSVRLKFVMRDADLYAMRFGE